MPTATLFVPADSREQDLMLVCQLLGLGLVACSRVVLTTFGSGVRYCIF